VTALIRGSSNKPGGPFRKPRADFYTVALVLALIAIILAILCLWLLMNAYDKQFKGGPVPNFSAQAQTVDHTVARAERPVRFGQACTFVSDSAA
jgi:predicted Co/Zn/Cd cation transporter (cation efflux family)